MVFFMCHCLAWFLSDYVQLTGIQVNKLRPLSYYLIVDRGSAPFSCLITEPGSAPTVADSLLVTAGRPPLLLQAGLRRRLVHQGVDGRSDLPVSSVGPDHQLENRTVPASLRRHGRGDPGCLVAPPSSDRD